MPVFEYRALNSRGKEVKGILEADSLAQLRSRLRAQGRYPVAVVESRGRRAKGGFARHWPSLFRSAALAELNVVTRQLATLLAAGIPLVPALGTIGEQSGNATLKRVLAEVKGAVNEGSTLTVALAEHPKMFTPLFVNMVRAGEASGSLDIVLARLADFSEKEAALRNRLRAALIYPIFMAVIGVAVLVFLLTAIVPTITEVFTDLDRLLPLPTRLLIELSDLLRSFWWLLLLVLLLAAAGVRSLLRRPFGRSFVDLLRLRLPVIGPVVQKSILARFASTLGSLLASGVALLSAMEIVRTLVDNVHVAKVVDAAMARIQTGRSMTGALADSPWFPPMFLQMVAAGEQSGALDEMLKKVAGAYELEVEAAILGLTSLLEPLLILAMGLAVGFVVLSILLPIFEMNQLVG